MKPTLIYTLFALFTLAACKNTEVESMNSEEYTYAVTKDQFKAENMKLGFPEYIAFKQKVHCTGSIVPLANGIAQLSLPVEGFVQHIKINNGQFVKQGQTLIEIGGNTFIDMQQSFASSAARLNQLKANFDRAKSLNAEKIQSEKEFMMTESAYKSELANYSALKIKLERLNLDLNKLKQGDFYATYKLKAPISGYITSTSMTIGQFIEPNETIIEIVNTKTMQLKISIFEKDLASVKTGQKVIFSTADNNNGLNTATISQVGNSLNEQSKAIECFARIENYNSTLVFHQLVRGEIIVSIDTALALPQPAVLKSGDHYYVLNYVDEDESSYYFNKSLVKTARIENGYVEIADLLKSSKFLTRGTYNLNVD